MLRACLKYTARPLISQQALKFVEQAPLMSTARLLQLQICNKALVLKQTHDFEAHASLDCHLTLDCFAGIQKPQCYW